MPKVQRVRQVLATAVAVVCFMTLDAPARQQPDDWFSRVPAGRSVVRTSHAMVVSSQPLASQAGLESSSAAAMPSTPRLRWPPS